MLDIMTQANNAIEAYNVALQATSANVANLMSPGYKRVAVSFQSIFERILNRGFSSEDNMGGQNPTQLGQGMAIQGSFIDFSAGEYSSGTGLDLAISGQGLFIVSPDGGNSYLYTRAGNFEFDNNGYLNSNGMQVYGLDGAGNLVPIKLDPSIYALGSKDNFQWLANGTLQYDLNQDKNNRNWTNVGFQVALTYFANPSALLQAQGTSFAETLASGPAASPEAPGGAAGILKPGQFERSNVFYLGESIDALEIQRAMSGNLTIVKMASDIISQFINKLG